MCTAAPAEHGVCHTCCIWSPWPPGHMGIVRGSIFHMGTPRVSEVAQPAADCAGAGEGLRPHDGGLSPVGQGLALTCSACCVAVDWSPRRLGQFQHLAMGGLDTPGRLSLTRRRKESFIWLLFICLARRPWHIVGAR